MKYFVSTTVTTITSGQRSTHLAYYNFVTANWQKKMTKQCYTTDRSRAEGIYSTRVLINGNTQLNVRSTD